MATSPESESFEALVEPGRSARARATTPGGKESATLLHALGARPLQAILLLLGCLYLPWLALLPLGGTLEANRLECAREMLRSGDWLVPRLGGNVYLAKPPFFPWTLALFSNAFGDVTAASGRLVTVLCALGLCCMVFAWGRVEIGKRAALYAALALGASVLFFEKALRAELEVELTFLTCAALLGLWTASWSPRPAFSAGLGFVAALALGAAGLVKGPVGLLVYAACAGSVVVAARGNRRAFAVNVARAFVLAAACALAWLWPLCSRLGMEPAWRAFQDEFLRRVTSAGRTNAEPVWFYGPALLVGLLPATFHLPCLALVLPRRVEGGERARLRSIFLWSWALLPVLLFSFSSGKETRYLLPAVPAWTLLLGWGWARARASERLVDWRRTVASGFDLATWLAPLAWIVFGSLRFPEARNAVVASGVGLLLVRALGRWCARKGLPAGLLGVLAVGVCIGKFAWASTVLEHQRRALPIDDVRREIDSRLAPDEPWALIGPYRSWLTFAVDRPCLNFPTWEAWREASPGRPTVWALAPESGGAPDALEGKLIARWTLDRAVYGLYAMQQDARSK